MKVMFSDAIGLFNRLSHPRILGPQISLVHAVSTLPKLAAHGELQSYYKKLRVALAAACALFAHRPTAEATEPGCADRPQGSPAIYNSQILGHKCSQSTVSLKPMLPLLSFHEQTF